MFFIETFFRMNDLKVSDKNIFNWKLNFIVKKDKQQKETKKQIVTI